MRKNKKALIFMGLIVALCYAFVLRRAAGRLHREKRQKAERLHDRGGF